MNYKEGLDYLFGLQEHKIKFGLNRIKKVLKKLDNPQKGSSVIHVAGTNGKGSTCSFIYSILREAGYKVGVYSSPHLLDFRERIQIDGRSISKHEVVDLIVKIKDLLEKLSVKLTYFEFITVISFLYFEQKKVDFAVIEVGMGGRLDATNVIEKPLVSLITNIDYEHREYLGDTLSKIAFEKGSIIKKKGFVVTGIKSRSALTQVKNICKKQRARLFCLGNDFFSAEKKRTKKALKFYRHEFDYKGIFNNYEGLKIKLLGKHQIENASLALACIEILIFFYGVLINKRKILNGLYNNFWPGRLEIIKVPLLGYSKNITFLLDGAHNPAAFFVLKNSLEDKIINYDNLFVLFGALKDKDIGKMLKLIAPLIYKIRITKPNTARAWDNKFIYSRARKFLPSERVVEGGNVREDVTAIFNDIRLFIDSGKNNEKKEILVLVTGSLYLVGEVKKILIRNKEGNKKNGWCHIQKCE